MKFRRTKALILAMTAVLTAVTGNGGMVNAFAAKNEGDGTATVRVLATADMHGQSEKFNYDSASDGNGSLAQISAIIKEKRQIKHGTSVTVDCGDNVYGIGAETLMNGSDSGAQYMYEDMKAVGYDAITLGNHDFDYGVDYIQKAISDSGMKKRVVLSNVVDAKTKKNLYKGGMIVKKDVTTTAGKKKTIKIGFVGAVVPSLTSKSDGMGKDSDSDATGVVSLVTARSWKGVIETKDIVTSVTAQAKTLKSKGADIVIALIHSGIGKEYPKNLENNVGYALTAVPEVDMVCAGHTHMDFPADTVQAAPFYNYAETSEDGLMHGKVLIQEKDHAASLGIADLKIAFDKSGKAYIKSQKASIRKITDADPEDPEITAIDEKYSEMYKKLYDQTVTATDREVDNYFGMIEDNPLIHLCNAAKIEYGLRAVKNLDDKYRNAPVIASTSYQLAGSHSSSNYIRIDGTVQVKDVLNLEAFNQQRAKVYYITGAQLKEELEWQAARFYQTTGTEKETGWDSETQALVDKGMKPVLAPEYQSGWEGFYVYDGIEYVVDPSVAPRYDKDGTKISDTHRIVSLTRNGAPISDSDVLVLVSKNISEGVDPIFTKASRKQLIVSKTAHISSMLEAYMKTQTQNGVLQMSTDGNWKVILPQSSDYIIKSSAQASETAKTKSWYQCEFPASDGYTYYRAALGTPAEQADTTGPFVCASPMETRVTGDKVKVKIEANDISGISKLQYAGGSYGADDAVWSSYRAENVTAEKSFEASQNGTYTVRAVDISGNANVTYVTINNINTSVSVTPSLKSLTNKTTNLKGTASPFATVHLEVSGASYDITADGDGNFNTKIKQPKADDIAKLYQIDIRGRKSSVAEVPVKRSGANLPQVDKVTNTTAAITGVYDDDPTCQIVAVSGKTAYVPKNAVDLFKASKAYKSSYTIKKCSFKRTGNTFSLKTGVQNAGTKYTIYGMDWISRLSSKVERTAEDVAPNRPKLNKVIAEEGVVYGYIPSPASSNYVIEVKTSDGETFTGTAPADGMFAVITGILDDGEKITVTARDIVDGTERTSAAATASAKTYLSFIDDFSGGAEFDELTDEDTAVTGEIFNTVDSTIATLLIDGNPVPFNGGDTGALLQSNGAFSYDLEEPLEAGTEIGVIVRNPDKSLESVDTTKITEAKARKK